MPAPPSASSLPASRPRAARGWRWPAGVVAALGVLALVVLHGWLLWRRIAAEQLFEPEVALRWLSGLVLLAGFGWLRRQGVPLLRGRRALVLWLLVAVLHLGVSATGVEGEVAGLDPATLSERLLAVPFAGGSLLLLLVGWVLALLSLAATSAAAVSPRRLRTVPLPSARSAGFLVQLSSRPPPL